MDLYYNDKTPLGTLELEFSERRRKQMVERYISAVAEGAKPGTLDDSGYAFDSRFENKALTSEYIYELVSQHPEMAGSEIL